SSSCELLHSAAGKNVRQLRHAGGNFNPHEESRVMTRRAVENIIGRAALDETFRYALFADPDATLAGFALTRAEIHAVKAIDAESLEYFARSPGMSIALTLLDEYHSNGEIKAG
ncbi:MAG: Franean1_4349 family RiPP, partial [Anaerolineae bacterium]|nr:Franean1_4349 family RiPP [Anaerolineae bacterium]MCB0234097.1 Franean1_4349 family RiPP [Anaerolineae bacterium]MCB0239867.1 Franean1_4349 family RiPP [Anaerolineae bacterium]